MSCRYRSTKIGQLVEDRVERAGVFAHFDHVEAQLVVHLRLLPHRLGQTAAGSDSLSHLQERLAKAAMVLGDERVEGVQQGDPRSK